MLSDIIGLRIEGGAVDLHPHCIRMSVQRGGFGVRERDHDARWNWCGFGRIQRCARHGPSDFPAEVNLSKFSLPYIGAQTALYGRDL